MEVILKTSTEILESSRSLDPSVFTAVEPEVSVVCLSEIGTLNNFQKVIADVKVLSVTESIHVSGGEKNKRW